MTIEIKHPSDPEAQEYYSWPFVYMHGALETASEQKANEEDWSWHPPDIGVMSIPFPTEPGHYDAFFYGKMVKIVLVRDRLHPGLTTGRACFYSDEKALAHVMKSSDWR